MSYIKFHNTKIFQNRNDIATSIYHLQNKELKHELNRLDKSYRKLDNVFIIPFTSDHTVLHLHGNILLDNYAKISLTSIKNLGYNTGQPCELFFKYRPANFPINSENIETTKFKLEGYIASANPEFISNGCCNLLRVIVGIPVSGNNNLAQLKYYLSSISESPTFTFKCRPKCQPFYSSEEEAHSGIAGIWNSKHAKSISYQFIKDFTADINLDFNRNILDLDDTKRLDSEQVQLICDICSDNQLITCVAPAGTGKTESICGTVTNGVNFGKKFLVICPTIKSCDAFLSRLSSWKPNLTNVLILRPSYAMSKYTNTYKRSEHYYFNEGLNNYSKNMTSYDINILNRYILCKKTYTKLQTSSTTCWTQEYIDELEFVINDMSNTEKLLPRLIMKYIKPQIIISTIDMITKDLPAVYINIGFDNIIIDDASHINTSTAIHLLSKFPKSNICYIGDLMQLKPFTLEDVTLNDYEKLLSIPVLELMNQNRLSLNLQFINNYRCHPQLVKMLTSLFYNGLLEPVHNEANYTFDGINFQSILSHPYKRIFTTIPFYLIDIPHNSHKNFTNMDYHHQEATNIAIFLLSLYETGVNPDKINIICLCEEQIDTIFKEYATLSSTYAKRLHRISSRFPEKNYTIIINNILQPISVGTVDDFQGHDNDYIIVSTTSYNNGESNTISHSHYLPNKICMALTKAKKGFFMFGNTNLMKQTSDWFNFYNYMSKTWAIKKFTTLSIHTIANVSDELTNFIIDIIKH